MGRVVWVHFNKFGAKRGAKDIWTVRSRSRNQYVRSVVVRIPMVTVYRGDSAPQPRAYLKGVGTVKIKKGVATIL